MKIKTANYSLILFLNLFSPGFVLWCQKNSFIDSLLKSKIRPEIPEVSYNDTITYHAGFSLLYNEKHEQANWVAYELTKQKTFKLYDRTDKFNSDPNIKTLTATNEDYRQTGFDRGHLAPAGDMVWSMNAMYESFYFSNISPQVPQFNRGIWKKLEEQVREWAVENHTLFIVTGPVLVPGLKTIGENKVSVPEYFYKVILDYSESDLKGIGFIIPNVGSKINLQTFAVPIKSVEKITGINFFYLLPNDAENLIENSLCLTCWQWKIAKPKKTK